MLLYAPQGKNKVGGKMKLVLSLLLPFALICNAFAEDTEWTFTAAEDAQSQFVKSEMLEEIYLLCQLSGQIERRWGDSSIGGKRKMHPPFEKTSGPTTVHVQHYKLFFTDPKDNLEAVKVTVGILGNSHHVEMFNEVGYANYANETEIKLYESSDDPFEIETLVINRMTGILDYYHTESSSHFTYEQRFSGACEKQTKTRF